MKLQNLGLKWIITQKDYKVRVKSEIDIERIAD